MQLSMARKCPDCNDGRNGEYPCSVCRGSGYVHLVPAERPGSADDAELFRRIMTKDRGNDE